jgi:hypothetical protein
VRQPARCFAGIVRRIQIRTLLHEPIKHVPRSGPGGNVQWRIAGLITQININLGCNESVANPANEKQRIPAAQSGQIMKWRLTFIVGS